MQEIFMIYLVSVYHFQIDTSVLDEKYDDTFLASQEENTHKRNFARFFS